MLDQPPLVNEAASCQSTQVATTGLKKRRLRWWRPPARRASPRAAANGRHDAGRAKASDAVALVALPPDLIPFAEQSRASMVDTPQIPDFEKTADHLIPVIAQDDQTDRVLMLAWMNEDAWNETRATGYATYYSRSRGKLWRKGETSGHRQQVEEIRVDCDADTVLLRVTQTGAACHEGFQSCFFRRIDQHGTAVTTDQRIVDPNDVYDTNR